MHMVIYVIPLLSIQFLAMKHSAPEAPKVLHQVIPVCEVNWRDTHSVIYKWKISLCVWASRLMVQQLCRESINAYSGQVTYTYTQSFEQQ